MGGHLGRFTRLIVEVWTIGPRRMIRCSYVSFQTNPLAYYKATLRLIQTPIAMVINNGSRIK